MHLRCLMKCYKEVVCPTVLSLILKFNDPFRNIVNDSVWNSCHVPNYITSQEQFGFATNTVTLTGVNNFGLIFPRFIEHGRTEECSSSVPRNFKMSIDFTALFVSLIWLLTWEQANYELNFTGLDEPAGMSKKPTGNNLVIWQLVTSWNQAGWDLTWVGEASLFNFPTRSFISSNRCSFERDPSRPVLASLGELSSWEGNFCRLLYFSFLHITSFHCKNPLDIRKKSGQNCWVKKIWFLFCLLCS